MHTNAVQGVKVTPCGIRGGCRLPVKQCAKRSEHRLFGFSIARRAADQDAAAPAAATVPPQQQQQPAAGQVSAADQLQEQQPASSSSGDGNTAAGSVTSSMDGAARRKARTADSTDPVASFLSRRFGLAGGLAWLGVLAVGSLGEQVKTRLEVAAEKAGTADVTDMKEVVLPSGVSYTDLRVGGGQAPIKGYLVVVDYVGRANGEVFESTKARGKPIVYLFGSRPFTGGICAGVEEVMRTMKAGGKRRIVVPADQGFGAAGAVLRPTEHVPEKQGVIPGGAELEYELELLRVSIPPS